MNPLERYKILHELGRGAIGTVFAARDRSTGAVVALKTLDPALVSEADGKLAKLFVENARSAARLKHRNIVKVLDAGEAAGTAYVAMELLVGESVRQALDKRPLSIARAIQIFDDIASALAYAHEEGLVHRGVKPANIIVLRSGVAKITDFGIGQIGEAALRYKSPEQVRGGPVDHRSDLFSLGAVLYEMLTRRALFDGGSPQEITENILRAEPAPPSELNPHIPAALDRILSGMLARNPDERVTDARMLLRELQGLKEAFGLGPAASARTGQPAVGASPPRAEPIVRTAERTELAPRAQTKPAAPPPVTEREPRLDFDAAEEREASFMIDRGPLPERSAGSRAATYAARALMLAAAAGVAAFLYYSPAPSDPRNGGNRVQEAPAAPVPAPVAEATTEPPTLPAAAEAPAPGVTGEPKAEPASLDVASMPDTSPPEPAKAQPALPAQTENLLVRRTEEKRERQPTAAVSKSWADGTAKLIITVSPQGELYIDGKHYGSTPPITTLDLSPGMHRIEIRSGSRKPYLTYMTVQAGEQRRIRHDFGARPSAPRT